jgi:DNA-binding NarL/FixJ family response regulator
MRPAPGCSAEFPDKWMNREPDKKRILLVDDHPIVRDGLAERINREADLNVCGEAEDRFEAIEAIEKHKPDLVIVDIALKTSNGIELIKDIHSRWPKLSMLVVSMHDEALYAERALRAGARGYLTKQEATHSILTGIRRILGGEIYMNQKTASMVLGRLAANRGKAADSVVDLLAEREMQVFELIGSGLSTRHIAERLHIDVKTVETYRARIKEKLSLKDSSDLLQMAIKWQKLR